MQVPAVPDWFKVGRIGLYVLAVVAMLVHLALFDDKSRERHHQALTRFSESIRSKSVNLFEMLTAAARLAREGLIKIYGRSFGRRLVVSTALALGYIALAAALTFIDSRPVLPRARAEKARLEKAINPHLKYSEAERNYAFDGRTIGVRDAVRFEYSHSDPKSIQIRDSVHNFDQSWEEALARHPLCEVLAWLTMLEGHPNEPGLHLAPAVSVVLSTVLLFIAVCRLDPGDGPHRGGFRADCPDLLELLLARHPVGLPLDPPGSAAGFDLFHRRLCLGGHLRSEALLETASNHPRGFSQRDYCPARRWRRARLSCLHYPAAAERRRGGSVPSTHPPCAPVDPRLRLHRARALVDGDSRRCLAASGHRRNRPDSVVHLRPDFSSGKQKYWHRIVCLSDGLPHRPLIGLGIPGAQELTSDWTKLGRGKE